MSMAEPGMTAVLLAGQRDEADRVAEYAGVACKSLVDIDGQPMLLRVTDTLQAASGISRVIYSGPTAAQLDTRADVRQRMQDDGIDWQPPSSSPSRSAAEILRGIPAEQQVLLTTADHPLLTPDIVDEFCEKSSALDADLVVALAPIAKIREEFPDMPKTVLEFRDGGLCGCNLFAFLTPASRYAADYWRSVEAERKHPLRVIRTLGSLTVLRYLAGWLSRDAALKALSRRLGIRIAAVILPHATAAVDVDSVSDLHEVEVRLARRNPR